MSGRAASLVLLFALAAALPACSNDKLGKVDTNPVPTDYKREIIGTLRELFEKNDTISVSNALISEPSIQQVGGDPHYAVCVRYTAHGASFNLTANVERIAVFFAGHLNQLVEAEQKQCSNAAYKPFPELNEVCLGKGCK